MWAQPHRWGRCGNTKAAWRYHQQTRERPWCRRWCSVRGAGGAWAARPRARPRPRPRPQPRGPRAMCKTVELQVDRRPGPATGGRGFGSGGGWFATPPPLPPGQATRVARRVARFLLPLVGGGGTPVAIPATPGARGSRSAAAAAPPVVPPTPHYSVGPRATARARPGPQGVPSAIASARGALVGCGRIDTLQLGQGSGHLGHSRRGAAGASTAAVPTTVRAGRVQQGTGAIWLAAAPPPPR